ncbi:hypothetical protein HPB52_004723 [Rhipicephalus sanguineus]|uniref:Uncharacterized protein n=1 Tax=Rhipicephalus sanguineus TaxID=34632 RepID=A0A9D4PQ98_RHISA|nr:hypothetical protein HPB52_004723 [Rhipicephalus sanguineus]
MYQIGFIKPYRLEDFREPLQELGVLKDVTGIGPFQMTHVWLIKLRTRQAKEALVNAGGLEVKGRFCAVIDPVQQDITFKVHWVPFHVTGEALKKAFDHHYGEVKEIRQEEWKVRGFEQAKSTTRIVRMTLREDLTRTHCPICSRSLGALCSSLFPEELQFVFVVDAKGILDETAECQGVLSVENSVMKHKIAGQPEEEGLELMEEEVTDKLTAPSETQAEQGSTDAEKVDFNVEPETPYETPDETATEEPATPAKRCRRDATTVDGILLRRHWRTALSAWSRSGWRPGLPGQCPGQERETRLSAKVSVAHQ